jgi:hypothetical protein
MVDGGWCMVYGGWWVEYECMSIWCKVYECMLYGVRCNVQCAAGATPTAATLTYRTMRLTLHPQVARLTRPPRKGEAPAYSVMRMV